ncbi:hypothetical protein DWB77_04082 [Streptomyces hundungensis]|uniref:Membrane-anchored protein n=1 Tax=Streptomyces hundungensis TaxID=1077946 RepID=A0A387HDI0_9ACTN|nr:hypothetical protein [Streptomyces hundungensis]AYG81915.1 hypothetical protein DWB77_04082 [Streptomyces hundungensis]
MKSLTRPGSSVSDPALRKLPQVTLLFWLLKSVAVTLGETSGDLLGITFGLGYATTAALFLAFFAAVVTAQVRAAGFHPALYWSVVLGTSMVGTEISDFLNRGFGHGSAPDGIGYAWGTILLTGLLAGVFAMWWRTGQTLDVENITGRSGEILYWIAILVSNTLGTSSGDWLADDTGLGFRNAFLLIAAIMLLIFAAYRFTSANRIVLFWLAFILTRPLGAAGGDSLTKPTSQGGLGWGTLWGSVALLGSLTALVACQIRQVHRHPPAPHPAPNDRRTGPPQRPNATPSSGDSAREPTPTQF